MKHLRGGRTDFRHLARPPRRDPFGRRVAERGQFLESLHRLGDGTPVTGVEFKPVVAAIVPGSPLSRSA